MRTEHELRMLIRAELPESVFRRQPLRALYVIPLVLAILIGSYFLAVTPLVWPIALLGAMFLGNLYASLMVIGHEILHGATVRSHKVQDLCFYFSGLIFCLSPHLWRIWHGQVHHPHTNIKGEDPDSLGTLEEYITGSAVYRFSIKLIPGSGHWLSYFSLFFFFTLQTQMVLWHSSKRIAGFKHLHRRRAVWESVAMMIIWLALAILLGLRGTIFVIVIPMLAANFIMSAYIITNHMLRPLTDRRDTLTTTISVATLRLIDAIHFNASHHVEHHLFPATPGSSYPLIRQCLSKVVGEEYLCPPHWWALLVAYRVPGLYEDANTLIEPNSGRRVRIADVETMLVETLS